MLGSVALVSLGVLQPASATLRHLAPSASEVLRQLSVSEELQTMLDSTPRPPDQLELLTKNHSPGMWASVKSYRLENPFPYINSLLLLLLLLLSLNTQFFSVAEPVSQCGRT